MNIPASETFIPIMVDRIVARFLCGSLIGRNDPEVPPVMTSNIGFARRPAHLVFDKLGD